MKSNFRSELKSDRLFFFSEFLVTRERKDSVLSFIYVTAQQKVRRSKFIPIRYHKLMINNSKRITAY
jgi:hypothetical protein